MRPAGASSPWQIASSAFIARASRPRPRTQLLELPARRVGRLHLRRIASEHAQYLRALGPHHCRRISGLRPPRRCRRSAAPTATSVTFGLSSAVLGTVIVNMYPSLPIFALHPSADTGVSPTREPPPGLAHPHGDARHRRDRRRGAGLRWGVSRLDREQPGYRPFVSAPGKATFGLKLTALRRRPYIRRRRAGFTWPLLIIRKTRAQSSR